MCATVKPPTDLSETTILRTEEDVRQHDPNEPGVMEIPAELVAGIWWLIHHRVTPNDTGELARGIELILVGMGEAVRGEHLDFGPLVASGLNQTQNALNHLIRTAGELREEAATEGWVSSP